MNVCLNTYPWAFGTPGGGERQLQNYHAALLRGQHKWPELIPSLFNSWDPQFDTMGLMHYFGCMPSSLDFINHIKKYRNIPIILSPNFWPDPEGWNTSGVLEAIKAILWLTDIVIVNSYIEQEVLVRLMNIDSSRIAIVPNAVDDVFFDAVSPEIFRKTFNISGPFILNVANVEPRKNQLAFLKALINFPNLMLVTIGGSREQWFTDACKAEGGVQFQLIPMLEPGSELLRSAMAGCEFFAMPSIVETPSIASLEAAAVGAKILTTHMGSTTEYFDDLAVYVNPYDLGSMQIGIDAILMQVAPQKLKELVREKYRWDIVVEDLVRVYSKVLGIESFGSKESI